MNKIKRFGKVLFLSQFICTGLLAQNRPTQAPVPATTPATTAPKPASPKSGPKAYSEVITDKAISQKGLFSIHKVDDRYFFEIGDSIFFRDILVVNRISKAPANTRAGFFGYAGDEINQNVIRFEKGPNNKIFMRSISYSVYAKDSSSPMFKSVTNSNIQPIAAAFDIKAFSKDSTGYVVDLTDFMNNDNDIFFFAPSVKSALRIGGLQNDRSYISEVRSYPINTEIRTVKTYNRSSGPVFGQPAPAAMSAGFATFELNTSILLLPVVPMQPRYYDDRVAYFTTSFTDFDADPQGVKNTSMITRWRLEVKPQDLEDFKKGKLVEPVKPIIFYIDPTTPAKWVPYLIQGVNDWQIAFEKAGFKNAIMARMAPSYEEDSTWSLNDARYSAIVYKPSNVENASGPHVHDPRSGEILESHINWFHNVMRLLRNWYMVQAGAIDPRARKPVIEDSLMGQLIRFVSSHEVGHTLGLPHNMGASNSTPVNKLRDREWLKIHGHTASIMDYARFNYVAQPEDNVGPEGIYPRINDYDKWSIEWGYKPLPGMTEQQEKDFLDKLVTKNAENPRLRFIHSNGIDPRAQTEDLGDNSMMASEYGIKNLKRILPNLPEWMKEDGKDYTNLKSSYDQVLSQFRNYIRHVTTNIAGINTDEKNMNQEGVIYSVVSKTQQREALSFLQRHVFENPYWLMDKKILDRIESPTDNDVMSIQESTLANLMSTAKLQRLTYSALRDDKSYKVEDYMDDLKRMVFNDVPSRKVMDSYKRTYQKSYVDKLINLVNPTFQPPTGGGIVITFGPPFDPRKTDITSVAKGTLRSLRSELQNALPGYSDKMSKYHLQDLIDRIDKALKI
jgi:hypothetical protein